MREHRLRWWARRRRLASVLGAAARVPARLLRRSVYRQLALARSLGARIPSTQRAGVVTAIRDVTLGGVDTAIEMAGATRAFDLAYRITRRGGMTVTAGLPPPNATWSMPAVNLVAEERTIKGSYVGTCVPMRDIPRYVDLFRGGRLPVDRLLTGTLALDDINHAFDLLHEGKAVRQVVVL